MPVPENVVAIFYCIYFKQLTIERSLTKYTFYLFKYCEDLKEKKKKTQFCQDLGISDLSKCLLPFSESSIFTLRRTKSKWINIILSLAFTKPNHSYLRPFPFRVWDFKVNCQMLWTDLGSVLPFSALWSKSWVWYDTHDYITWGKMF